MHLVIGALAWLAGALLLIGIVAAVALIVITVWRLTGGRK